MRRLSSTPLLALVSLALLCSRVDALPAFKLKFPGCLGGCLGGSQSAHPPVESMASSETAHSRTHLVSTHRPSADTPLQDSDFANRLRVNPLPPQSHFKVFGGRKKVSASSSGATSQASTPLDSMARWEEGGTVLVAHGEHHHSGLLRVEDAISPRGPSLQRLASGRESHHRWAQGIDFNSFHEHPNPTPASSPERPPSPKESPSKELLDNRAYQSRFGVSFEKFKPPLTPISEGQTPLTSNLPTPLASPSHRFQMHNPFVQHEGASPPLLDKGKGIAGEESLQSFSSHGASFHTSSTSFGALPDSPLHRSPYHSPSSSVHAEEGSPHHSQRSDPSSHPSLLESPGRSLVSSTSSSDRFGDEALHRELRAGASPPYAAHFATSQTPRSSPTGSPYPSLGGTPLGSPRRGTFEQGESSGTAHAANQEEITLAEHSPEPPRRKKLWQLLHDSS